MNHLFIPYKLAKKLKQKGFDEPCFCVYNNDGKLIMVSNWEDCNDWSFDFCRNSKYSPSDRTSTPTYQQVTDWFREKHNISIEVYRTSKMITGEEYGCQAERWTPDGVVDEFNYYEPTYYQALTKGIEEALTLI